MKQHYHFIGIGGIGMGALALLLLEKGMKVSGSDAKESHMTESLKGKGAKVFLGHDARHIDGADVVVYSSAVKQDNPELAAARYAGKTVLKRAELLARLMIDQIGVTVAGAHGKTTTSSMIATLLSKTDFNPTIAVGGIVVETLTNANLGKGEYFVAEVDESDGSFLYFFPKYSVVTNIDHEHMDHYGSFEELLGSYKKFISQTQAGGCVIGCGDDKNLLELLKATEHKTVTYGFLAHNDLRAADYSSDGKSCRFQCFLKDRPLGEVILNVMGRHNALNALACIAVGLELKIDIKRIIKELLTFHGVQRRFQKKGIVNSIRVVDDYAHHPTEIKCTLSVAKEVKTGRLIVVFQPHRYSRFRALKSEFLESLKDCDSVIVTDVYAASEAPIEGVSSQGFAEELKGMTQGLVEYVEKDKIVTHVLNEVRQGDMILTLGAGDITKICGDIVHALEAKYSAQEISS